MTKHRDISQKRNFAFLIGLFHLKDTANHHSAPILNKNLCFDMLCINCYTLGCGLTSRIFVDIQVKNDISLRSNLRRNLQLQHGFFKGDCSGTIGRRHRIGILCALLYQSLRLVSGHQPGAGYYLPLTISLHRRKLQSQRTRSEEHTSELQSQSNRVCRLLLEKQKKKNKN